MVDKSPKVVDRLMGDIGKGRVADSTLIYFSSMLDELNENVDRRIFKLIDAGNAISPESLLTAFGEKKSYRDIKKKLVQAIAMGKSSGDEWKKLLNEDKENGGRKEDISGYSGP